MKAATPTSTAKQIQRDGRIVLIMMRAVARVRLPDQIHVEADRPTLLAGNHRSLLDIFCAAAACANAGTSCRLLVQARYFESALIGRWLRRIGCIALSGDTKDVAFAEARAALDRGELVGIMPEGRLVPPHERDRQVGPGRPGAAELAASANARLRPIVFHNTDRVWPRDGWPRFRVRRPLVTLELGEAFEPLDHDPQVNVDRVMAALTKMLDDLDATVG